ncbi:MAG TPA: hypothetical protein VMT34_08415 [Aggregatilineales bacterium]|nr:hypothetical protein [Aggregatilineales bacterium]
MPQLLSIPQVTQFIPTRYSFAQPNVPASQSGVQMKITATDAASGTLNLTDYVLPFGGSIYAIAYRLSAAVSTGTLSLVPTINGTPITAAGLLLSAVSDTYRFAQIDGQTPGARFAVPASKTTPNRLGCQITTSGTWSPTNSDLWVDVYLLFDGVQL